MRAKIRNLPIVSYIKLFLEEVYCLMRFRFVFLFMVLLVCLTPEWSLAQVDNRFHTRNLVVDSMRVKLDTLSVVPSSFVLTGAEKSQFVLDPVAAVLYLKDSSLMGKTLSCSYQTFLFDYSLPRTHKSLELIERSRSTHENASFGLRPVADLLQEETFVGTGSISRGISLGNNQDMVLNSSLNLQLSGKLSEDIDVVASISDKNIPIQPDGNTQMLSDINNIFITILYKNIVKVHAGDLEIKSPTSYFLSVNRNLLGMDFYGCYEKKDAFSTKNTIGGGVAKGRFCSQKVVTQNGVQGPYRLYGAQNEIGIVVVAGSERVYVDGVLIKRGQEFDYVMDYNLAEITFTPQMLVTAEKRVVVEFEYTDRHYTRYNLYTYNEFSVGNQQRLKMHVNFYQEQDLKNQPIQPELTDGHKLFLAALGDDVNRAYYETVDTALFSQDQVLYCRRDTIVNEQSFNSVYVYSRDSTLQLYRVNFSYVGTGNGSYVLSHNSVNGRVFAWVAPVNGALQGDYAPVLQLSTPKLSQMTSIGAEYRWKQNSFAQAEFALSNFDGNTFSKLDDKDNVGFAFFVKAKHDQILGKSKKLDVPWHLLSTLDWQFTHRNFQIFERYREVEFARDYNYASQDSVRCSEQMLAGEISVEKASVSKQMYTFSWLERMGCFRAFRQTLFSQNRLGIFDFGTQTSFLNSKDAMEHSRFVKSINHIETRWGKIHVGIRDLLEHNRFVDAEADTLRCNSYAFNEMTAFVGSGDSLNVNFDVSYKNRVEYRVGDGRLTPNLLVHEANAQLKLLKLKNQRLSMKATYRNQRLLTDVNSRTPEHYFVGNLEYAARFLKGALSFNTYYEMGSGMELKKAFAYLKVAKGQGTHVWMDYNANGIEEIEEFEVASYVDEADYVKVWLPGTDYVNTYNNMYSQSLQLRPAAVWGRSRGVKRFVSRFSDQATFRSQLKDAQPIANPFYTNIGDTNVIAHTRSYANTFSFNNSASKFAFDYIVQGSQNKNFLYYGFEYCRNAVQQVVVKSTPLKWLYLQADYVYSKQGNRSDFMLNRNYQLVGNSFKSFVQVQIQNRWFASMAYAWSNKMNVVGNEQVERQELKGTFNFRSAKRGSAQASLQYVHLQGVCDQDNAVTYQLMEGLTLGHNVIWTLSYLVSLTDYMQLSLQYDGRKTGGGSVVHTGSLMVKAQF